MAEQLQALGDGTDQGASHVQEQELQEEDEQQEQEMHPWEQHAGVILMPRYLYGSQAHRILQDQRPPGFLITCSFQREKSATKEGMAFLREYLGIQEPINEGVSRSGPKRLKTEAQIGSKGFVQDTSTLNFEIEPQLNQIPAKPNDRVNEGGTHVLEDSLNGVDSPSSGTAGDTTTGDVCSQPEAGAVLKNGSPEFFLVKLARKGMVYISISRRTSQDVVTFFSKILSEIHSRTRVTPQWCHRIFPVQATCRWAKDDIHDVVIALMKEFLKGHKRTTDTLVKFAVAVNKRGLEDLESKEGGQIFGKMECIHVVAEAVQSVAGHTLVDLTNPGMVVIVEILPLVRVESSVCAVSVLPRELMVTKPKLMIQALAPPKKQKQQA